MSISQDSTATTVCREVFDETSPPTNEEVIEYAKRLGIDPESEPHLLHLAREGLVAPLPKGWRPCSINSPGLSGPSYYYYHEVTKESRWEHPLDSVYKELVLEARGQKRLSFDDDSKTTAKELDSHEEATLPKDSTPGPSFSGQTKIPMKLPPMLKPSKQAERRKDSSLERQLSKRDSLDSPNYSSLMTDRASRDYKNLNFKDPNFYQSPRLLESPSKMKEVLKRSESLSPRYEKDWEQLASKIVSDEQIIDINKMSITALTPSETNSSETSKQPQPQKGLPLSGGGYMFLKSNRSKESTPCNDDPKLDDFQEDRLAEKTGDKLKSILRDKMPEDDDRPNDEERKSVRFDLNAKEAMCVVYTEFEDDCDSDSYDNNQAQLAGTCGFRRQVSLRYNLDSLAGAKDDDESAKIQDGLEVFQKTSKKVGKRFLVENVSESEHNSQMGKSSSSEFENDYVPDKFVSVRKIDIVSVRRDDDFDDEDDDDEYSNHNDLQINMSKLKREKEILLKDMKRYDEQRHQEARNQDARIQVVREEYDARLDKFKEELELGFEEQKSALERSLEERLDEMRRELALKEKTETERLIEEMDVARIQKLGQLRSELEACYDKERQEILATLKTELDRKREELLELRNLEMTKLENEFEKSLDSEMQAKMSEIEIVKSHNERLEALKKDLDNEFEEVKNQLRSQHQDKVMKITDEYEKNLAKILRDFRIDENLSRKVYKQRLEELRTEFSKDLENETKKHNERVTRQDNIDFEKLRCEKRLLEDKYNTLKEKYLKLKKEVRLLVERRNRRKEGNTTASETEKSTSVRTRTEKTESSDQKSSPKKTHTNSVTNSKSQGNASESQFAGQDFAERAQLSGAFAGAAELSKASSKFESDDTTTASETHSNLLRKKKLFTKKTSSNVKLHAGASNPVENIRKQLEKLEDIGDLLPSNETAYTVRYPFQDKSPANVSSELEFFRHRIHVERDSVRRAREALRQQKSAFQGRQKAWKQRSARATLEQLVKEERELSEMEITLHRTRSLLGEKVIHLKHLEQSLERVANAKKNESEEAAVAAAAAKNEEMTLSDMSSASSGFSSTDLTTETFVDKPDHYQESTEIIASLENLNSEIREIWGVLNKRHDNNVPPPPPALMYPELNWLTYPQLTSQPNAVSAAFGTPNIQSNILSQLSAVHPATTTQNIISQYGPNSGYTTSVGNVDRSASNLTERMGNLRDWIRQARIESSDLISPGQATL